MPCIQWDKVVATKAQPLPENNHQLVIMDCCAAGLANPDQDDVEVIGASAWESPAAASTQTSFTRALIDEVRAVQGTSISTTQLFTPALPKLGPERCRRLRSPGH